MGTVARKEYAVVVHIEPGDRQARVVLVLPVGAQDRPKARVVVQREGEAPISEELPVEVAA
jgi:hypothetical protein